MISIRQIQHFHSIFETGSMHAAAESLHLTQPALTHSIANLEGQLGVQLFERSSGGMRPTEFAMRIAPKLVSILRELNDVEREARLYRSLEKGQLRIGVGQALREALGRRCVAPFIRQNPGIALRLKEGTSPELITALQQRDIDLIIAGTASYRGHQSLVSEALHRIPLQVMANNHHPLRTRRSISFRDLLDYPLAAPTALGANHPLIASLPEARTLLEPQYMASDYEILDSVVENTDAWTVSMRGFFARDPHHSLSPLEVVDFDLSIDVGVIELTGRSREPAAQAFIDSIRQQL